MSSPTPGSPAASSPPTLLLAVALLWSPAVLPATATQTQEPAEAPAAETAEGAEADDKRSELDRLLAANVLGLTVDGEAISGPGAERLLEDARGSEMVLIGESHGNRETPQLTSGLLAALRPHGYGVLAIETGPLAAELLVDLARDEAGVGAFRFFLEEYPFTFAFFWWREEVEMLRAAVDGGYRVWGLDQEFVGSGRYLLDQLASSLDGAAAEQAAAWAEQAREGYRRFAEEGDQSAGFLNVVDTAELYRLRDALPESRSRERRILDELAASAIVYQHFGAGRYYLNNRDRIRLMKRHFVEAMSSAGGLQKMPKVLLKFGSAHMGRGYSPFHQLDLGNQAAELSVARGGDSYHLLVLARRSVRGDQSSDWAEQSPYLARLDAHRPEGAWGLFDLAAMRPFFAVKANREAHPDLAETVFRFDALLLAPVFHAADALTPLPF